MFGLFLLSVLTLAQPGLALEQCKKEGITDEKACFSKVWEEREGVPMTQDVYNRIVND